MTGNAGKTRWCGFSFWLDGKIARMLKGFGLVFKWIAWRDNAKTKTNTMYFRHTREKRSNGTNVLSADISRSSLRMSDENNTHLQQANHSLLRSRFLGCWAERWEERWREHWGSVRGSVQWHPKKTAAKETKPTREYLMNNWFTLKLASLSRDTRGKFGEHEISVKNRRVELAIRRVELGKQRGRLAVSVCGNDDRP